MWTYEELLDRSPKLTKFLTPQTTDALKRGDKKTREHLEAAWTSNVKHNVKRFFLSKKKLDTGTQKYGLMATDCWKFGLNKATLAIGAGSSLNINKDLLKRVVIWNGMMPVEEQPFLVIASNHQAKPCIDMGLIPHFVLLIDSANHLKKQMDVGYKGKHTTLLPLISSHPDCIASWKGPVRFVIPNNPFIVDLLEKETGEKVDKNYLTTEGGNVLNMAWCVSFAHLGSRTYIMVGNDLSYPMIDDIEKRRKAHYADGDYSTNTASQRDEASYKLCWAGFKWAGGVFSNVPYVDLELRYTSPQFYSYKTWLEVNASILSEQKLKFQIYNASEQGILGVIEKPDRSYDERFNPESWQLMDKVLPRIWRTRTLKDALSEFLEARAIWERAQGAQSATGMVTLH